jgi:hypothetical protein
MAEGRVVDAWRRTASQMAQQANLHRDPKKGRPRRPSDFFRFPRRWKKERGRIEVGVNVLRDVFVTKKV